MISQEISLVIENISSNQLFSNLFSKTVAFTKFLPKTSEAISAQHSVHSVEKWKMYCYTVWKLQKFTLTYFWQKFRESNVFTKGNTKELIWRNIFSVRVNFSFFTSLCYVLKFFSSNQLFNTSLVNTSFSRNFCQR